MNNNPIFPVIIKPTHVYSTSVGVTKVSSLPDLKMQFRKIELLNKLSLIAKKSSVIVENYIEGTEYAVDLLWTNRKRIITFVHQNKSGTGPDFLDHLYFIDPVDNQRVQNMLENAEEKVDLATAVIFGFTHTEYRIHNGVPYVIESSNRPAGAGMLFSTIERSTGYNMINIFYDYVLDDSKILENNLKVKYNVNSINFWMPPPFKKQGLFESFNGLEKIQKLPYIYSAEVYLSKGDYFYSDNSQVMYPLVIKGEIYINKNLDNIVTEIEEKLI
ncbi:ATP-grasp domain-containing protein [Leuconostoc citreum]|uniref:ATP-grasp domain-containing protein n=1 Tax=Leuconostoc citreum TaxID=33964 RepID=UPI0015DB9FAE|nr:ATP-grasp domain-containing protein [Leuconostoc citreum]